MGRKNVNINNRLIEKCKKKNRKAQFEIYKLYFSAMFNTCYRIVNDKVQAEDIMQEAFLVAFDKIESYEGKVSFGAWLKKIVVNKSIDYIRKNKFNFEDFEEDKILIDNDFDYEIDNIEKEYLIKQIKSIIQKLPEKYRIVFSLYYFEGFDHDEIAEIYDISPSTSRSQLARAKAKIVEMMKKENVMKY